MIYIRIGLGIPYVSTELSMKKADLGHLELKLFGPQCDVVLKMKFSYPTEL